MSSTDRKIRHAKGSRSGRVLDLDEPSFKRRLMALDLDGVRAELIRKEIFYPEHVEGAINEYRRFLLMQGLFLRGDGDGCAHFIPPDEIGEVWHVHILDTRRYASDCEMLYGRFLHHGYAPSPGTAAYAEGAAAFVGVYTDLFGDPPGRFTYTCEHKDKNGYAAVYAEGESRFHRIG